MTQAETVPHTTAIEVIRSRQLTQAAGLVHGFSSRRGGVSRVYRPDAEPHDGDLNLGFTANDDPALVQENRRRFLKAVDDKQDRCRFSRFVLLRQEHTAVVHALSDDQTLPQRFEEPGQLRGDGAMTDRPGVLLAIGTADCVPVLVFDPLRRAVAAFHAGWRGTIAGIVQTGIKQMQRQYGSEPATLLAAIGPAIGPESYAVSDDVRQAFAAQFPYAQGLFQTLHSSLHLDLWEANRRQLLDAGLPAQNIEVLGLDTAADTGRFFSHRAERGLTGRMLSVIGLAG